MDIQQKTIFPSPTLQLKWPGDLSCGQRDVSRSRMCYNLDFITRKETDCSPITFPSDCNKNIVIVSQVLQCGSSNNLMAELPIGPGTTCLPLDCYVRNKFFLFEHCILGLFVTGG